MIEHHKTSSKDTGPFLSLSGILTWTSTACLPSPLEDLQVNLASMHPHMKA